MKQAKEEAQAEIEQYRLQREKDFKAKEAAVGYISMLAKIFFSLLSFLLCPDLLPAPVVILGSLGYN